MIINRKNGVRLAAVGAAAAATMGFFSVGAANADTFVPLPGGSITQTAISVPRSCPQRSRV